MFFKCREELLRHKKELIECKKELKILDDKHKRLHEDLETVCLNSDSEEAKKIIKRVKNFATMLIFN